jgi:hypothetical protein
LGRGIRARTARTVTERRALVAPRPAVPVAAAVVAPRAAVAAAAVAAVVETGTILAGRGWRQWL